MVSSHCTGDDDLNMGPQCRGGICVPQMTEWHTLVVALQGALVGGFIYTYSTYSNALQAAFDFSESEKETIGMAFVICNLVTFTCGLIMDYTSVSVGCILAGVIMCSSTALYGAIALRSIPFAKPSLAFFMLGFTTNYGAAFIVGATFTTLAKNFDGERRSSVVSVAKAWTGLSAGVGTAIFIGLFGTEDTSPNRLRFLYFLAVVAGGVPVLIAPFLGPLPPREQRPQLKHHLVVPEGTRLPLAFGLTVLLLAVTLLSSGYESPVIAIMLLAIIASPLLLVFPRLRPPRGDQSQMTDAGLEVDGCALVSGRGGGRDSGPPSASPWEGGPAQMIRRLDFYLLWLCTFCLQSGGLFVTINLGSMVESRTGPSVAASSGITVFACAQGLARLVTGSLSAQLVRRKQPRTWCFPILMLVMAGAHALFCVPGATALLAGVVLSGCAFGACYPLLVLTVAEVFGTERVASNYMVFDGTPGAIGVLVYAKLLAQSVYNRHADVDGTCHGDVCFRQAHLAIVASELMISLLGCWLALRTRVVYSALRG